MKKTHSLITELMAIITAGLLTISVLLLGAFIFQMRTNSDREIERFVTEATNNLQNRISAQLAEFSTLLDYTIMGALPLMTARPVNEDALLSFFEAMLEMHEDVQLVYGTSAGKWTQPGEFMVFSDGWIPDDHDYDNTEQAWHADAIAGNGKTVYTDPYIDDPYADDPSVESNSQELVVSVVKAVINNGRTIGMAGLDISMNALDEMANEESSLPEIKSFILHSSGLYISNPDISFIMEHDFFEDHGLEEFRAQVLSTRPFFGGNNKTIICSLPINIAGWTLVSVLPRAVVYADVNRVTLISILLGAAGTAIFLALFMFIVKKRIQPIQAVSNELKEIAEGEGDLTRTIEVSTRNEIGDLAYYFNMTIEKIKNLVISIKKESAVLSSIGSDLAANMNETASAVNEITAAIQSIKERVVSQGVSVSETHATMEKVTAHIKKLTEHIEDQSSHISQATSDIQQMVANTGSVTETLVKNAANVETLNEASEVGRSGLQGVAADIQEISRESEGLLEINSVMKNIASQTNLLSMNAAIEAAHAGESGKGFAVVADEIRKLAVNSSEQSKTIGTVLKKIKESIDKIQKSTENVLGKFEAIETSVRTVAEQEENIRGAMEKQGSGSKQILEGVGNINAITGKVKNDSKSMLEGAQEVIKESKNLDDATQQITFGMNEMVSGVEHINGAVHYVNEITVKNREGIDALMKEVSRFKV